MRIQHLRLVANFTRWQTLRVFISLMPGKQHRIRIRRDFCFSDPSISYLSARRGDGWSACIDGQIVNQTTNHNYAIIKLKTF